ncbi:MAG: hypothetical protein KBB83_05515 [Alphaproteobacteria bacterium]|nr:hypothetical protein [Alphaproteobacteria bacterium]
MLKKSFLFAALLLSVASPSIKASSPLDSGKISPKHRSTRTKLVQREFPNYYEHIAEKEQLPLMEKFMGAVLDSLDVPHVDEGAKELSVEGFFQKIVQLVHQRDPGAKVFVAGGMVRSLLGYNYKKLFKSVEEVFSLHPGADELMITDTVQKVFNSLIHKGNKRRNFLKALGVNSDFDILIEFSNLKNEQEKNNLIYSVTDFINSAEGFLGLAGNISKIKKSVVPQGDVQEYQKQFGFMGRAVSQGGLSLDWLAYDLVERKIRMPAGHENILDEYFKGRLNYLHANSSIKAGDKQSMRALRPLLEIPFAGYDETSENLLANELEALTQASSLSVGAIEQVEKTLRNAQFGSGGNLLAKPDVGDKNRRIRRAAKKVSDTFKTSMPVPLAAEFLERHNLDLRESDKHDLSKKGILMPVEEFINRYTNNGNVLHGTSDILNVINMVRNGFLVSNSGQGAAFYGRGFYTTKNEVEANSYANTGLVIPLQVNQHKNLRILNLDTGEAKRFADEVRRLHPFKDLHEVLTSEYDIDIIINTHVLIQNSAALKLYHLH